MCDLEGLSSITASLAFTLNVATSVFTKEYSALVFFLDGVANKNLQISLSFHA